MRYRLLITSSFCRSKVDLNHNCFDVITYDGERMDRADFLQQATRSDVIVTTLCEKVDRDLLQAAPDLKMVANTAVGYDNIDVPACTECGVIVSNTPGVLDETTADLAMALLLGIARRTGEAERLLRAGKWQGFRLDFMLGADVHGKTLGIVGLGRIGRRVARRAQCFNMKVLYHKNERLAQADEQALSLEYAGLPELLEQSDFVSLHVPYSPATHYLIGAEQLKIMKPTAYLVNTARGGIVDQAALVEALERGTIAGAALDVFEHEPQVPAALLDMENVLLLPHIGSATIETRSAMARMAVDAVKTAFSGERPANLVNPEAWRTFRQRAGL